MKSSGTTDFSFLGFTLHIWRFDYLQQWEEENAFRASLFQVVSIITTTGFSTADYLTWSPILTVLLFSLFFFGGSAGSTGGVLKL
jgi:trk system potassium uptake protein